VLNQDKDIWQNSIKKF